MPHSTRQIEPNPTENTQKGKPDIRPQRVKASIPAKL